MASSQPLKIHTLVEINRNVFNSHIEQVISDFELNAVGYYAICVEETVAQVVLRMEEGKEPD